MDDGWWMMDVCFFTSSVAFDASAVRLNHPWTFFRLLATQGCQACRQILQMWNTRELAMLVKSFRWLSGKWTESPWKIPPSFLVNTIKIKVEFSIAMLAYRSVPTFGESQMWGFVVKKIRCFVSMFVYGVSSRFREKSCHGQSKQRQQKPSDVP